jgi:branched-chain amino acid transport system ATP-binding protein
METAMAELLRIDNLSAGYGEAVILHDICFSLAQGETLALLGRNGTGKTTLINTIAGAARQHGGRILLGGEALHILAPHQRAAAGIGWVPQERDIFKSLTVLENLTAVARPGAWTPSRVFEMFPRLAERKSNMGNQLSGGEQQMLAVGRALVLNPRLLLLDEPVAGMTDEETERTAELFLSLKGKHSLMVVEHDMAFIRQIADVVTVLCDGSVLAQGSFDEVQDDERVIEVYLGR